MSIEISWHIVLGSILVVDHGGEGSWTFWEIEQSNVDTTLNCLFCNDANFLKYKGSNRICDYDSEGHNIS